MTELKRLKEILDIAVAEFNSFIEINKIAIEDVVPEEISESSTTDNLPMTRNNEDSRFSFTLKTIEDVHEYQKLWDNIIEAQKNLAEEFRKG